MFSLASWSPASLPTCGLHSRDSALALKAMFAFQHQAKVPLTVLQGTLENQPLSWEAALWMLQIPHWKERGWIFFKFKEGLVLITNFYPPSNTFLALCLQLPKEAQMEKYSKYFVRWWFPGPKKSLNFKTARF